MLSVKVSSKYQIAVPSEARRKLGLKAGDRLDVEIEGDVIHLRRHVPAGTRLYGIGAHLYDGTDAAERIRAMRDEDEARWLERRAEIDADIRAAWAAHGADARHAARESTDGLDGAEAPEARGAPEPPEVSEPPEAAEPPGPSRPPEAPGQGASAGPLPASSPPGHPEKAG